MRVLITGSRTWTDRALLFAELDNVLAECVAAGGKLTLVHGHAIRGADRFADEWGKERGGDGMPVTVEQHPAYWDGPDGKAAGFVRNAEMVDAGADLCVTFIERCGCSKRRGPHGTHGAVDCATKAADAGIPVRHVRPRPQPVVYVCGRSASRRRRPE